MEHLQRLSAKITGKKNKPFKLYNETISPGERASLGLPMPELLGYAPLYMPVKVINGRTEGPVCLLVATMRGDEFNGMESIKRIIELAAMDRLHGTLIAVPVLNVFGMLNRSRFLPGERLLEDTFPGSENGNYAARTAHLFMESIFQHCDFCVHFRCGELNHRSLPHVYGDFSNEANRELALSYDVSVLVDTEPPVNSLQSCAKASGKPMVTFNAGEAMRFNNHAIVQGSHGTARMLRKIGMLPTDSRDTTKEEALPLVSKESEWVYATKSGIAHLFKELGERVSKGTTLARINEPLGSHQEVRVNAPMDGIIVGVNDMPMVYEGDYLYRIASFEQLDQAVNAVEAWSSESGEASGTPAIPAPANAS